MDYRRTQIQFVLFLSLLLQIYALVLPPYEDEVPETTLWHPPEDSHVRTRDEWMRTHGLGDEGFAQLKEKVELIATKQADAGLLPKDANFTHAMHKNEALDGCIKLSEEQADLILQEAEYEREHNSTKHVRRKRKLYDFRSNPSRKWSMPIRIMFDGQHSEYEKHIIRAAFKHWEEGTCIRFQEVPTNARIQGQYVLITRQPEGCFTFVGKTSVIPQQFNLEYNCLWEFGIPVHEIGHILGLWHEHQREDRDAFIKINWENLGYYESQFYKINTLRLGQTYDYSSVMHYSSKEGSKNGKVTIEATDRRFQSNMGQRIAASFIDKKMINLEYCKNRCYGPEPNCRRDGYQDPNNCFSCICPDGFSGDYCQYVDSYRGPEPCGGLVNLHSFREIVLESPGYERGYYQEGQSCNWLLKAPPGFRPVMRFEGEFGVYCHLHEQCYHWVEVRTDENLGANGGRYCCYTAPQEILKAQTDEMLITFRSNYSSRWTPASRGFRMIISTERVYNPADRRPVRNPVESRNENEYPPPGPAPPSPPLESGPEVPSHFGRPNINYPNSNTVGTPKPADQTPDLGPFPYPNPNPFLAPREGTYNQNQFGTPRPASPYTPQTPAPYVSESKYIPQTPSPSPYWPETPTPQPDIYRRETPSPYRPETPSPYRPETAAPPQPNIYRPETPSPYRPERVTPQPDVYKPETGAPIPDIYRRETPSPYRPETATPQPVYRRETPAPYRPETATPQPVYRRETPRPYRPDIATPQTDVYRRETPSPYRPETATPQPVYRRETPSSYRPETATPQPHIYRPETGAPIPEIYRRETPSPYRPETATPQPVYRRETPSPYRPETATPQPVYRRETPSPYRPETATPQPHIYRPETGAPIPEIYRRETPSPYRPETATPQPVYRRETPSPYRPETATPQPDVYRRETPSPYRPETPSPYRPETLKPDTYRPETPAPYRPETHVSYQPETQRPETPSPHRPTPAPNTPESETVFKTERYFIPTTPTRPREVFNNQGNAAPPRPNPLSTFDSDTPAPYQPVFESSRETPSQNDQETPSPYVPPDPPPAPYNPSSPDPVPYIPPSPTPAPYIPPSPTFNPETSIRSSISRFPTRTGENTIPPVTKSLPSCSMADIALVLDASGSMTLKDYRKVKAFCSDLIEGLNIGVETARMGVITFANRAIIEAHLLKYLRKIDLQYAVNVSSWKHEWTNTSGALTVMRKDMFNGKFGDRTDRENIAIMVIGGKSNLWSERTITQAGLARQAGIDLYVVGVSNKVDKDELEGITGNPLKVMLVPNYDALLAPQTAQHVLDMVCSGGRTPPPYSWECSFEPEDIDGPWCGIQQVDFDDFEWTLWSRPTPSAGTGPDAAYHGSYYVYIEATSRKAHEQAIFMIPKANQKGEYCLDFYYHMDGHYVGTLQVFVERAGKPRDYPITIAGSQGEEWLHRQLNVVLGRDDQIGFRGVRGEGYLSDIALDKISLAAGRC